MKKDFISLFEPLKEISEFSLYDLVEEAHLLTQAKIYNPVPNTLRKFYECILYRCESEIRGFELKYHDEKSEDKINLYGSSTLLFKNDRDFYKNTIKPFLDDVNKGSHCSDVNYAKRKKTEIYKHIGYIIDIWNWYAKNVRGLDKNYLITEKYDLPVSIMDDYMTLKMKLESKDKKVQELKEELEEIKVSEQETTIDFDSLEKDIYDTINIFNERKLYCTHKTVALFLLGDRIEQTDYANLSEMDLFGKYSKNKFSEFEYDSALRRLIAQEKILQTGMYFTPFDKNAGLLTRMWLKFKTKIGVGKINKKEYKSKINLKYIEIIQKAIDEDKKIKLEYSKTIANTMRTEKSIRILKPTIMVPRDKKNEIYEEGSKNKYTENLYYLGAIDDKDNKLKMFRLDSIKGPKIIE